MTYRLSPRRAKTALGVVLIALCAAPPRLPGSTGDSVSFPNSVRAVATSAAAAAKAPRHAQVSRAILRSDERAASMTFEVALRMRNFDDLQARVARGEFISDAEKKSRYFPTAADHDTVVRWLKSNGLTVTRTDDNRLAVFGRGTVDAVARAFQVTFARVTTDEGEFTSAVTSPSLPADVAGAVAGVHGLQPHLRPHRLGLPKGVNPNDATSSSPPYFPSQIARVYNANSLSATGAGQTIAIYAFALPQSSDLTNFWGTTGISQSLANIKTVNVAGGPANPSTLDQTDYNNYEGFAEEVTLDTEWSSSLAPGATIRIYAASQNDPADNDEILQQVYADLPSQPNLHILSICIGGNELEVEHDYLIIEAQYMANLASAGVTVLSASGDSGALDMNGILDVSYPTSDPDVTGVGGTALLINHAGGVQSEVAWNGGGGVSAVFSRPPWQKGNGVPSGNMRLVPDVAAAADPNYGAFLYFQNSSSTSIGGTSWATPVWAAFCALVDQTRAANGLPPMGLLNTSIYSLMGTAAFRDITVGSDGYYSAGIGYDLCTGIGVPDVAVLAQAMLSPNLAPIVTGQLGNRTTVAGQPATFFITAFGAPTLSYQWQRLPVGASVWTNLTDSGTYSGSATPTLIVSGTTLAMSGDEFQCSVSNSLGSAVSSPPATLGVNTSGVTTLAGWPGVAGSANGAGWAARFNYPGGVRISSSGTIYVADSSNYTVRQITPAGVVTTLAGTAGTSGSANGSASAALFNGIGGVAPDTHGNVYVADSGNYTIRLISSTGTVSTVAGLAGTSGHADGSGTAAQFSDPENLAFDVTTGNIYVADGMGNTIRMVTPAGVVTTLAGSGTAGSANLTGSAAEFSDPSGIAVDTSSNVYVGDTGNDTIRKITPAGVVTTLAGLAGHSGSANGNGTSARFDAPAGVAVDSAGNVYVADTGNDTIREISPSGTVTTLAGSAGIEENIDGPPLDARFWTPGDIAIDSSGTLYVADTYNMTIRRYITGAVTAPSITAEPLAQTTVAGGSAMFSVAAAGTQPFSYQWYLNGIQVVGATSSSLTLTNIGTSQAGSYTVTVSNSAGTATSSGAIMVVNYSARLVDIAARGVVGTGSNILIAGFGVGGTGSKKVLIRGVGPSLAVAPFYVGGTLASPELALYDSGTLPGESAPEVIVSNNNGWANNPTSGDSPITITATGATAAVMSSVGAFPLQVGSADAAMLVTAPSGNYTAEVSGAGGATGVALAEIYDADTGTPATRLSNISARAVVGVGANILIGGFAITGTTPETVLIRAVGPGLATAPFFLPGALFAPTLTLYDSGTLSGESGAQIIASNKGWSNGPDAGASPVPAGLQTATGEIFTTVGAFSLASGSADCAMIATLPPGNYTAEVSGTNGTTGIALVEIYEVP